MKDAPAERRAQSVALDRDREVEVNTVLWVLQFLLGGYFLLFGMTHFVLPPSLPGPMGWMYELPRGLHYLSGTAEILGGFGLILPSLTRIRPQLTPLAGTGLILTMVAAAIFHISRGELPNLVQNFILAGLLALVAYGRWRVHPILSRQQAAKADPG